MASKQIIFEENKRKNKVFAKIAHEFKTPINSIIGVINILKESEEIKFSKTSLSDLDLIQNLSTYTIFLISDIIQYANDKNINDIKIKKEKVNLRLIMEFCFNILKCLLNCNKTKSEIVKAELILDEDIDGFSVYSDEIRLKQILLNFISNAVKFTNTGKIILESTKLANKEYVIISISDTGIGIKDDDKRKLFNDFFLIDENQKEFLSNNRSNLENTPVVNNMLGSGLGLSICKTYCEKMKIKLKFNSEYGKGSKFSVIIPIKSNKYSFTNIKGTNNLKVNFKFLSKDLINEYNANNFEKNKDIEKIDFDKINITNRIDESISNVIDSEITKGNKMIEKNLLKLQKNNDETYIIEDENKSKKENWNKLSLSKTNFISKNV